MLCVRGSHASRYDASRKASQSRSSGPTATAETRLNTFVGYESTLSVTVLTTWTWPLAGSTPYTNECPATQNPTFASERSFAIVLISPVVISKVRTRLASSTNHIREPVVARRCGLMSDGSDRLYTPGAIAFAPSRTSGDAATTTAGDGLGDFAGSGVALGVVVATGVFDAAGDASVVTVADGAELAATAAPA